MIRLVAIDLDGTQSQGKRKTLSAGKCDATMEKLIRIINLFF